MKKFILPGLLLLAITSFAQEKATFDLTTFDLPAGWKKQPGSSEVTVYATTNATKGTYCQIAVYKSTTSKGNTQADFESEWQTIIVNTYKPTTKPELVPATADDGWQAVGGVAPFQFNGAQSLAMLVTMTGYGRCASIAILTNTQDYQAEVEKFLESVTMEKPEITAPVITTNTNTNVNTTTTTTVVKPGAPVTTSGYQFSTTNFDDGWVSTVQDDWVQTVKENVTVLIHYPSKAVDESSLDFKTISQNAWNTIVAPRYSNLKNYYPYPGSMSFEPAYCISGDVTDSRGNNVYVVLFRKGNSGWLEFITPDKNTFLQTFGLDIQKLDFYTYSEVWDVLSKMKNYNKFAVAATDLKGTWSRNFSGMTQYVNSYTGLNAGATAHSSLEHYVFEDGSHYHWDLSMANGWVGAQNFQGAKSNGTFTMSGNWQLKLSDIDGRPKTYDAYFSCLKGGRMLWLSDTSYPGYTGYAKEE